MNQKRNGAFISSPDPITLNCESSSQVYRTTNQLETNPIKRYYAKPTRKNAINAFCSHCVGSTASEQGNGFTDHLEPSFRTLIRQCTAQSCPLHEFRPFRHPNE